MYNSDAYARMNHEDIARMADAARHEDARAAALAYEDEFFETEHCTAECFDESAVAHSAACSLARSQAALSEAAAAAPAIAAPVAVAIGEWLRTQPCFADVARHAYAANRSESAAKREVAAWMKDWTEQEYPLAIEAGKVNWQAVAADLLEVA